MSIIDPSVYESRPYQPPAVQKLAERKRSPFMAPMGSGKTLMTLGGLDLAGVVGQEPIIIYGPNMALGQWRSEISKWLGIPEDDCAIAQGDAIKRRAIWKRFGSHPFVLTNYSCMMRDKDIIPKNAPVVIADEAHKMRNRKTQTYKTFKHLTLHSDRIIMPTGTWARKGPQDAWTLLNIAKGQIFRSYWKFVNTWCVVDDGYFGKEILGPRNIDNFVEILHRYAVYIPEEVVEPYLPQRHRIIVPVEMSPYESRVYHELAEDMMTFPTEDVMILTPSVLSKIVRFRQLLCTPKILAPTAPIGSGLEFIAEKVEEHDTDHFVIFTPFTKAIPHIKEYIQRTRKVKCLSLQGGISVDDMRKVTREFKESGCALVISIHFAESYDLETCDLAFFLGFDFAHDVNKQAEDRLRRTSSLHDHCTFYYIQHKGTYEEEIMLMNDMAHINISRITKQMFQRTIKND